MESTIILPEQESRWRYGQPRFSVPYRSALVCDSWHKYFLILIISMHNITFRTDFYMVSFLIKLLSVIVLTCSSVVWASLPMTADKAMENPAGLKDEEILNLFSQDEGGEAWAFSLKMVGKIRRGEFCAMPGMEKTTKIMKEKINELLDGRSSLLEGDKKGFSAFLEELEKLEDQKYPYIDSVILTFIFSNLLYSYYREYEGLDKGNPTLNGYLYDDSQSLDDKFIHWKKLCDCKRGIDGGGCSGKYSYTHSNLEYLIDLMLKKDRFIWVTFTPLEIHHLNLMHYLPITVVGFTTKKQEWHDARWMDCRYLPIHDVTHEYDIQSGLSFDLRDDDRKRMHKKVQNIYCFSRKRYEVDTPERSKLFPAIKLMLFVHLHEQGRSIDDLSLKNIALLSESVDKGLRPRNYISPGKYSDLPSEYLTLRQTDWLLKAELWLHSFNEHRVTHGVNLTRLSFDDIHLDYQKRSSLAKKRIGLLFESESELMSEIDEELHYWYDFEESTSKWGRKSDLDKLFSLSSMPTRYFEFKYLYFWLAAPPECLSKKWECWDQGLPTMRIVKDRKSEKL